jgi:glycogen debranching enzyme
MNKIIRMLILFVATNSSGIASELPTLTTGDAKLDHAFLIALSDVSGNIHPYQSGLLEKPSPVFIAGAGYNSPWTRDAAINTWNGGGLIWPSVARNTLLSVLDRKDGKLFIGGQYWDAIIWTTGAWAYYLDTGDRSFLSSAFEAITNTLAIRETEEFDPQNGLFRGAAVYGDGISAYPDRYAQTNASSGILEWVERNSSQKAPVGYGLPMFTLSANCTYLHAYELLPVMAKALDFQIDSVWLEKAARLRKAINQRFWNPNTGIYDTLTDPWGTDDRQEAIGLAFSVLFKVADQDQQASLFRNAVVTPAGIPCLWPTYSRYSDRGGFGRHSGTIWPHAEALWADAAAEFGHADIFLFEMTRMAEKAVRDGQFYELFNPISGQPDGGLQEKGPKGIISWRSEQHQTWSATGFLRLILFDLAGIHLDEGGIVFAPLLPGDLHQVDLTGVKFRAAVLEIHIRGSGNRITKMTVNGRMSTGHRIPVTALGEQEIDIELGVDKIDARNQRTSP